MHPTHRLHSWKRNLSIFAAILSMGCEAVTTLPEDIDAQAYSSENPSLTSEPSEQPSDHQGGIKFIAELPDELVAQRLHYTLAITSGNTIIRNEEVALVNGHLASFLSLDEGRYTLTLSAANSRPHDSSQTPLYRGSTQVNVTLAEVTQAHIALRPIGNEKSIAIKVKLPKADGFFLARAILEISSRVRHAEIMPIGGNNGANYPCYGYPDDVYIQEDQAATGESNPNDSVQSDVMPPCWPNPSYESVELKIDHSTGFATGFASAAMAGQRVRLSLTFYDRNGSESFTAAKHVVLDVSKGIYFDCDELSAEEGAVDVSVSYDDGLVHTM